MLDELGRRQAAQSGMRAALLVVQAPGLDREPCMRQAQECVFVEQLVRKRPLKLSALPSCIGRPGSMKCNSTFTWAAKPSIVLLANSANATLVPSPQL